MRPTGLFLAAILATIGTSLFAQDAPPVPERRLVMTADADFYGSDLNALFDTTAEACANACLATPDCRALTFNGRSNACFLKSEVTQEQPYEGAVSGRVLITTSACPGACIGPRQGTRVPARGGPWPRARSGAGTCADASRGPYPPTGFLAEAAAARAAGDAAAAMRLQGAALNLTARGAVGSNTQNWPWPIAKRAVRTVTGADTAVSASINAYLRADRPAVRRTHCSFWPAQSKPQTGGVT